MSLLLRISALSLLAVLCVGCSSSSSLGSVQPWEKQNLARRHMQFDPDPVEARYTKKVYAAKEGTSGGYGIGGGGCGCN